MPEVCEVRSIVEKLRSRLKDKTLLFMTWLQDTKYSPHFNKIWPNISHLFPTKCLDILCKGKQIFFFLENGLSFINGLGTEGHWYYYNFQEQNNSYTKFCLHFGYQTNINDVPWQVLESEIHYSDMLSRGNFTIGNWNDAFVKMKTLGPDLLATTTPILDINPIIKQYLPSEFFEIATLHKFATEIRIPRRSQMLICVFLLKHQEIFSGLGNYLVNEVLYWSRIHPNRKLGFLNDQDIILLFSNILTIIFQAYNCGGLTHGTFLDPDRMKGVYEVVVYKRENQLDPNGFVIKRIKTANGRSTYIVEELQK
jgi:formamidopyrimidine-DNA glycosylase